MNLAKETTGKGSIEMMLKLTFCATERIMLTSPVEASPADN